MVRAATFRGHVARELDDGFIRACAGAIEERPAEAGLVRGAGQAVDGRREKRARAEAGGDTEIRSGDPLLHAGDDVRTGENARVVGRNHAVRRAGEVVACEDVRGVVDRDLARFAVHGGDADRRGHGRVNHVVIHIRRAANDAGEHADALAKREVVGVARGRKRDLGAADAADLTDRARAVAEEVARKRAHGREHGQVHGVLEQVHHRALVHDGGLHGLAADGRKRVVAFAREHEGLVGVVVGFARLARGLRAREGRAAALD